MKAISVDVFAEDIIVYSPRLALDTTKGPLLLLLALVDAFSGVGGCNQERPPVITISQEAG